MTGHPDTARSHNVVDTLHLRGEFLNAATQEEVVVLAIETTLAHCLQEVGGYVESMQVSEALVLHGLPDNSRSAADIEAEGAAWQLETSLARRLARLVDNVLGLSKVDDARPLVVALRSEARIPLLNVARVRNVVVELVDDKATFVG